MTDPTGGTMRIEVFRYRPGVDEAPYYRGYDVPWTTDTSVLDALNWIKDHQDPTLAFRWSCRMGICGSCGFTLNGEPKLGCEHFVREYAPGPLRIGPLENMAVERDLVVDVATFTEKLEAVTPWVVAEEPEDPDSGETTTQTPLQMLDYHQYAMCINCLLCYSACPQVGLNADFLGPAAITLAIRYDDDSRDHGAHARLPALDTEDGVWGCTFVGACSDACPKGVDPAAAVNQGKLAVALDRVRDVVLPRHGAGSGSVEPDGDES